MYLMFLFRSRDLIGMVTVHLADADLYGISTKMEIDKVPGVDIVSSSSYDVASLAPVPVSR